MVEVVIIKGIVKKWRIELVGALSRRPLALASGCNPRVILQQQYIFLLESILFLLGYVGDMRVAIYN